MCCRHIYRILRRLPERLDFHPMCFKTFEISYGVDKSYTDKVNALLTQYESHRGLIYPGTIESLDCSTFEEYSETESFFAPTLEQSQDMNPHRESNTVILSPSITSKIARSAKKQEMQSRHARLYEDIKLPMNLVDDDPSESIFRAGATRMFQELLTYQNEKQSSRSNASKGEGNVVSLPGTDRRAQNNRMKPMSSPSRYHPKK